MKEKLFSGRTATAYAHVQPIYLSMSRDQLILQCLAKDRQLARLSDNVQSLIQRDEDDNIAKIAAQNKVLLARVEACRRLLVEANDNGFLGYQP